MSESVTNALTPQEFVEYLHERSAAIEAVMLATADGIPQAATLDPGIEEELLAATCAQVRDTAQALAGDLQLGEASQVVVGVQVGAALVQPLHGGDVLVVLTSRGANLGFLAPFIRGEMKQWQKT